MKYKNVIFDFDSTIITIESLDYLLKIVADGDKEITKKVKEITDLGMAGKLDFRTSLLERFKMAKIHRDHIRKVEKEIVNYLTDGIESLIEKIHNSGSNVFIISGGFKELILPVAKILKISEDRVFANSWSFDSNEYFGNIDCNNPLSASGGKVTTIKNLSLTGKSIIIGDGYTDFEVSKNIPEIDFICFTGNVRRESVTKEAKTICSTSEEILKILS